MPRLTRGETRSSAVQSASSGLGSSHKKWPRTANLASAIINRRTIAVLCVVLVGGLASMTKTFGDYGNVVRNIELLLGGDWALHLLVSFILGLVASWATPPRWLHRPFYLLSPITIVVLILVTIDELLQIYSPLRKFSYVDMAINTTGVLLGALCYVLCCYVLFNQTNRQ